MEERFHRRWRRWGFELGVTGEGTGEEDGALCPLRGNREVLPVRLTDSTADLTAIHRLPGAGPVP